MPVAGMPAAGRGESADLPPPRLSIVAPCFNEAEGLMELHRRTTAVCAQAVGDAYEIVLVR